MRNYFTHYWKNPNVEWHEKDGFTGHRLDHTAGNQFVKRGIKQGDRVYAITVKHGCLYLIGAMSVRGKVYSYAEAERKIRYKPFRAKEHLIDKTRSATTMRFDRRIPLDIVRRLRFVTNSGLTKVKMDGTHVDRQTLRVVRMLHPDSAALLDKFLLNKPLIPEAEVEVVDNHLKPPRRTTHPIRRLERNSRAARELKQAYKYKCQLCNKTIELPNGERYAEVHHLRPLGKPHNGKEGKSNTIVVCPQHHALFDLEVSAIDPKSWRVKYWDPHRGETVSRSRLNRKHDLDNESVEYHYQMYLKKQSRIGDS